MEKIKFSELTDEELIIQCKKHPDVAIFHELFARYHKNDVHMKFSENFLYLINRLELIDKISSSRMDIEKLEISSELLQKSVIDSIFSSIRAIFLENNQRYKNNYTLQNCLTQIGYKEEANLIEHILDSNVFVNPDLSFRKLIKDVVDTTIAHVDDISNSSEKEILENRYYLLANPNYRINLINIISRAHCVYQRVVIKDVAYHYKQLVNIRATLIKELEQYERDVLGIQYEEKIVIIDTGCANLSSVKFAFDRLGYATEITSDLNKIKSADKLILPGVGTAIAAMKNLQDRGLVEVIQNLTQPVLGICLGMQLMTAFSEEGNMATLSLMPSQTALISDTGLPLPHMGWNNVRYAEGCPLFDGIAQDSHFYFVHSYAVLPNENTIATSQYGVDFSAAIARDNFYGVQFHPERSGENGVLLLKNFVEKVK